MSKVLIVGADGQLGHDCMEEFGETHDVNGVDLPEIDITELFSVKENFETYDPEIVVNCAAYTNVDAAETNQDAARAINAVGPGNLAKVSAERGVFLVHVSTDYVFSGDRKIPETAIESDPTHPVSVYGRTKRVGENFVAQNMEEYAILRTAWLYGINGKNFLKTMLKLACDDPEREIRVVNDQFGSPTFSRTLARQICVVAENRAKGIFHATGEGYCTWYDLASTFLKMMDVPFKMVPCSSDEYPTSAKRPKNSILENHRLKELNINVMKPWQDDLAEFTELMKEKCNV